MNWWQLGKKSEDLERELESDLQLEEEEQREAGHSAEEARHAARRAFGNVTLIAEQTRETWRITMLNRLLQDLRFALRLPLRSPGFTAIAVITLALGVGATTAIFSVVSGVVLKPLPYPQPEQLVDLKLRLADVTASNWGISQADYLVFRDQNQTLQGIGMYDLGSGSTGESVNVTGLGNPERVPAMGVTASALSLLGVRPFLGRSFSEADDESSSEKTVMLSYGYWRTKFGADSAVIGKTVEVDSTPRVIIGVLPKNFSFLDKNNLAMFLPIKFNPAEIRLGSYDLGAIARLKPGVTLQQLNADVTRMIPIVFRTFPPPQGATVQDFESLRLMPKLQPLKQEVIGNIAGILWVLMGGIGLVLLIACANVANLLLLRAEGRQQELAIRAALGASRARIAAGLLSESLILGLIGGLSGLALAYGALRILVGIAPAGLARVHEIGIDGKIVLFTLIVSLTASLLFGSVPVFKYAGPGIAVRLRQGGRSMSESRERHRSRGLLVIVQVALAVVLLASSGLMIRTFIALTKVNPGFSDASHVQTFRIYIPESHIKDPVHVAQIEQAIAEKLQAIGGVSAVGSSANIPMDGSQDLEGIFVRDRVYTSGNTPLCRYEYISPGFFRTLGTPLINGRDFTWNDIYNKFPAAMVSESFARQYWGTPMNALGKQIRGGPADNWHEVVGVVGNIHQDGLDKEAPATVYLPFLTPMFGGDNINRELSYVVRSQRSGLEGLVGELRQAVWAVDPEIPAADVLTLGFYYSKSMARTSFALIMLGLAGGMALLLGIIGLYGVIAYSVSQRIQELGIRMALGAQRWHVFRLVLVQGMTLTAIGIGIGVAVALGLTHFLSAFLYGVKSTDLLTFGVVSGLLMLVAVLASYLPARRAAKVDPIIALRYQ